MDLCLKYETYINGNIFNHAIAPYIKNKLEHPWSDIAGYRLPCAIKCRVIKNEACDHNFVRFIN